MSKEEGDMSQGKRIPPPKKRQKCKVVFISSPSVRYKVKRGETILKRLASLTAKKNRFHFCTSVHFSRIAGLLTCSPFKMMT